MRSTLACIGVLAVILPTGGPLEAQDADFSGTWNLDRDASEFPQEPASGGRGGRGRGGGGGRNGGFGGGGPATITIAQAGGQFAMTREAGGQSQTVTYRLDGSASENSGPRGGMTTTMSSWDGAALVTQGSRTMSTLRGAFTLETQERRTLSDDGQTMTVASTRTTPRGEIATTLVYRKSTG